MSMRERNGSLLDGESVKRHCIHALKRIYFVSESKRLTTEFKAMA